MRRLEISARYVGAVWATSMIIGSKWLGLWMSFQILDGERFSLHVFIVMGLVLVAAVISLPGLMASIFVVWSLNPLRGNVAKTFQRVLSVLVIVTSLGMISFFCLVQGFDSDSRLPSVATVILPYTLAALLMTWAIPIEHALRTTRSRAASKATAILPPIHQDPWLRRIN